MPPHLQIRADFDRNTIVVYQAFNDAIANAAIQNRRFSPPFSTSRMTWIKPSFLWLMARSNWGKKSGQQRILKVRMSRAGWDHALAMGVLTSYDRVAHRSATDWDKQFQSASVHVQWDPERSIRGQKLEHRSIQVGLSRAVIGDYVSDWVVSIEDVTPTVKKMRGFLESGRQEHAKRLLPKERPYPVSDDVQRRLGIDSAEPKRR